MTAPVDFSEYYKTISNTELLNILDNPRDYQPPAVEAAKKEFANRQLSEVQIQEARQPLIAKQIQKEKEREKVKAVETKIRKTGHTFVDTINPVQSGIPSAEKTIRLIVIVFASIFLYQLLKDFRSAIALIKDLPHYPLDSAVYLIYFILLPVAVFTFWKRKTTGWILLTIFLSFSCIEILWELYNALTWRPSGVIGLDNLLFPRPPPTTYFFQLIFITGAMYVISKQDIREIYSISKQRMAATISITAFIGFILMYAVS